MSVSAIPRRIMILAGEQSGDLLGAGLMRALKKQVPHLQIEGVGGQAMAAEGLRSLFPMQDIAVMGFAEVVPSLPRILGHIRDTVEDIIQTRPDIVITIDAQGFAARVGRQVHARDPSIMLVHYVAPSVWAWKPWRARKLAEYLDYLLCLLPFEPAYFEREGLAAGFVGHPATERLAKVPPDAGERFRHARGIGMETRLLAVLPGSRRSEIHHLLPIFTSVVDATAKTDPDLELLIPLAAHVASSVAQTVKDWPLKVHLIDPQEQDFASTEAQKLAAFQAADAALAASGTVALELALSNTPMVIAYKVNWLTAAIVRRLVKIDTATLANLIVGEKFIPEFFQEDCTSEKLIPAVQDLLDQGQGYQQQLAGLTQMKILLQQHGDSPSARAADALLEAYAKRG